ncbi:hypothetical protein Tco_0222695 [Tanacetum coccineum]
MATNNPVNEVHSNDNQIFDNVDYQLSQEMHQEEHLDSDAETEMMETIRSLSMIAILTDLQTQLDGHAKVNQEKCLEIETLNNELLQCKQEICRLDTHKVKLDLENKVRQEQALVIQRNKRNAELVQENDLLKSTLSGKEKSIAFLQSEKEKILSEKKDLADSYLDEIVCLKNANKVARDMLQRFNMPTQTIPMLSKKPKAATADLHKDLLGTRNPGLGYMAKRAQPVLYDADTLLHPTHHPVSIWDSEEVLVHQVVSMKKMNEKPGTMFDENGFYETANALKFVHQHDYPRTGVIGFRNEICYHVLANLQKVNAVFHNLKFCMAIVENTKVRELEAEVLKQQKMVIESEKPLETDRIQLKDTITSLRIQLDGLKVENVSLKRRYDELSKANTHSRTAYTKKLSALTSENTGKYGVEHLKRVAILLVRKPSLRCLVKRTSKYGESNTYVLEDLTLIAGNHVKGFLSMKSIPDTMSGSRLDTAYPRVGYGVLGISWNKFENASKSLDKLIECQIVDNCKKGLGYEKYNAVPPPYIRNFMPPTPDLSFTGLDEFVNKPVVENRKSDKEVSEIVRKNDDASIVEEWVSDSKEEKCVPA